MKKGQGSLEYLLILAAILAIAVVVVVVANSLLSAPTQQTELGEDKVACGYQQIELVNYNTVGDISGGIKYKGNTCLTVIDPDFNETTREAQCTLGTGDIVRVNVTPGAGCYYNITNTSGLAKV